MIVAEQAFHACAWLMSATAGAHTHTHPMCSGLLSAVGFVSPSSSDAAWLRHACACRMPHALLQDTAGHRPGEVPRTYFPMRSGNKVTLYHDAVCTPGPVPGITLAGGGLFSESSCWDDMYDAILQAKR